MPYDSPSGHSPADHPHGEDQDRAAVWEDKWSRPDYSPRWRISSIPAEIADAVADGWLRPGARMLDIGCGSGEIAAWLADHGLDVLAVDVAPSAIARARSTHGDRPRLSFEVVDICDQREDRGRFDALLDRGCLHGIAPEARLAYVEHVCAVAAPGAKFLLMHRVHPDSSEDDIAERVRALCGDGFRIERVAPIVMARDPTTPPYVQPGMVFWMTRR